MPDHRLGKSYISECSQLVVDAPGISIMAQDDRAADTTWTCCACWTCYLCHASCSPLFVLPCAHWMPFHPHHFEPWLLVDGQSRGVLVAGPLAADEQIKLYTGRPVFQLPGACLEHWHLFPQAFNPQGIILEAVELLVLVVAAHDLLRQKQDHDGAEAHQCQVQAPLGQPGKHLRTTVHPLWIPPLWLIPGGASCHGGWTECAPQPCRMSIWSPITRRAVAPCSPNAVLRRRSHVSVLIRCGRRHFLDVLV